MMCIFASPRDPKTQKTHLLEYWPVSFQGPHHFFWCWHGDPHKKKNFWDNYRRSKKHEKLLIPTCSFLDNISPSFDDRPGGQPNQVTFRHPSCYLRSYDLHVLSILFHRRYRGVRLVGYLGWLFFHGTIILFYETRDKKRKQEFPFMV